MKIKISKSHQAKIRKGYPWVFYYQVQNKKVSGQAGDLGIIYDADNKFLALGLYDPYSDIRLRVLQVQNPIEIDQKFFKSRLLAALDRRACLADTTGYRAVNGENDGLPGLIIDRYADTLAVKIYTAAWVPHLNCLTAAIQETFPVKRAVLLLSRHAQRTLPEQENRGDGTVLFGAQIEAPVRFLENGLSFEADVLEGQKTGFFLDQRDNRKRIQEMAEGKSVLNVFSYSGGFSVYAVAGGCRSVLEVDINKHALQAAKRNMQLNFSGKEFDCLDFRQIQGDAFEQLSHLAKTKQTFDMVILDPPAFANSKKHKKNAIQSYIRLARSGAKRTNANGILFAASCSSQISASEFYRAVDLGIKSAGRGYKKLLKTGHGLDHPVTFKEGAYLKAIFCEIKPN